MKVFGIAGHSGMGKTTLLERLVPELTMRRLVVSLIKHSHKTIEIDRPGKDSHRLHEAGCSEVGKPTLWPAWPGIAAIASDGPLPSPGVIRIDLADTAAVAEFVLLNAAAF